MLCIYAKTLLGCVGKLSEAKSPAIRQISAHWFQCKATILNKGNMNKKDFDKMTNEELLVEKKNLKNSKIFHALAIGFLAGILAVGLVSWSMSAEKRVGFLIPMLIPVIFIYKMLKNPNQNNDLEEVLKKRGLN
jgi:hypothetical protein